MRLVAGERELAALGAIDQPHRPGPRLAVLAVDREHRLTATRRTAAGTLARDGARGHLPGRSLDSLPDDWTDIELDLRIVDERRYIEAATFLVTCNAQPYSEHDWHWRILCAHRFGNAAAAPAVHALAEVPRRGGDRRRARGARGPHRPRPVFNEWGRPESVREEFRRRYAQ